jgi:hypothetical protein
MSPKDTNGFFYADPDERLLLVRLTFLPNDLESELIPDISIMIKLPALLEHIQSAVRCAKKNDVETAHVNWNTWHSAAFVNTARDSPHILGSSSNVRLRAHVASLSEYMDPTRARPNQICIRDYHPYRMGKLTSLLHESRECSQGTESSYSSFAMSAGMQESFVSETWLATFEHDENPQIPILLSSHRYIEITRDYPEEVLGRPKGHTILLDHALVVLEVREALFNRFNN